MSAGEIDLYRYFKEKSEEIAAPLTTFSIDNRRVEIFFDEINGINAKITSKDGRIQLISKEWISEIPQEIARYPEKLKKYLASVNVFIGMLDNGDCHLYVHQGLKGGANFMEDFFDLLPSTNITVYIKFPNFFNEQEKRILLAIVKKSIDYWRVSGFNFNIIEPTARDEINDRINERNFDSIYGESKEKAKPEEKNPFDLTLDFQNIKNGQAFAQQTCKSELFGCSANSLISIDLSRDNSSDIIHEIGHGLFKFLHEHQRYDKPVDLKPTPAALLAQPAQYASKGIAFGEYDEKSVMHYSGFKRGNLDAKTGSNQPTLSDLLAARFLFNETRIKEKVVDDPDQTAKQKTRIKWMKQNKKSGLEMFRPIKDQNKQLQNLGLAIVDVDKQLLQYANQFKPK